MLEQSSKTYKALVCYNQSANKKKGPSRKALTDALRTAVCYCCQLVGGFIVLWEGLWIGVTTNTHATIHPSHSISYVCRVTQYKAHGVGR